MSGFDDEPEVVLVVVFVLDNTGDVFLRCPITGRQLLRGAEEHEIGIAVVKSHRNYLPVPIQDRALIGLEGATNDLLFDAPKRGGSRFGDGLRELGVTLAEVVPRSIPRKFAGAPGRRGASGGGEGTCLRQDAEERVAAFLGDGTVIV